MAKRPKKKKKSKNKVKKRKVKLLDVVENKLIHQYGTKVCISMDKNKKGKIIFEYYSKDDLNLILDILINKS